MAFWTASYRPEAMDRDHPFFWQDFDGAPSDDTTDFFGQFVDFDGNASAPPSSTMTSSAAALGADETVPRMPESFLLDQPSESLGSSTADEFDFLSSSSQVGPTSSVGQDVDPNFLTAQTDHQAVDGNHHLHHHHHQSDYLGRASISDTELPRVEGMSLSSPTKTKHKHNNSSISQPPSPTPHNTTRKTTNKFVEAVQSTIRKATNRRKPRRPLPDNRPDSPTDDAPLKAPRQRPRAMGGANKKMPISPPVQQQDNAGGNGSNFIHGSCEDPFSEVPPLPPPSTLRYFHQGGISPPMESPGIKSEPGSFHAEHTTSQMPSDAWQHQQSTSLPPSAGQWNAADMMLAPDGTTGWWDYSMVNQNDEFIDQKNADFNIAMHSQQAGLPYEYHHQVPDTATSGLMIQMPQPRQPQPDAVNDLTMNAQAQFQHPPPPPQPATDKPHRPPRAPSSGARHLSCSPVRKSRAPSASPTRTTPTTAQQRHSSGGSVSSTRSASGRLPASMPGTPCSVRKRRSREPSGGSAGGSGDVGFVNFTPSDGGMLMTGVAPSGSSKTKARREKEALDRRRKLSEAALKAVAAAGGDVDQLMGQGFSF